jgi:hypothetical protein
LQQQNKTTDLATSLQLYLQSSGPLALHSITPASPSHPQTRNQSLLKPRITFSPSLVRHYFDYSTVRRPYLPGLTVWEKVLIYFYVYRTIKGEKNTRCPRPSHFCAALCDIRRTKTKHRKLNNPFFFFFLRFLRLLAH